MNHIETCGSCGWLQSKFTEDRAVENPSVEMGGPLWGDTRGQKTCFEPSETIDSKSSMKEYVIHRLYYIILYIIYIML